MKPFSKARGRGKRDKRIRFKTWYKRECKREHDLRVDSLYVFVLVISGGPVPSANNINKEKGKKNLIYTCIQSRKDD